MKQIVIFTTVIILQLGCKAQEIVDVGAEPLAFNVQTKAQLTLSNDLKKDIIKGFAILSMFIDKDGNYAGFNIKKLIASRSRGLEAIDYVNIGGTMAKDKNSYPLEIQYLYQEIEDHIKGSVITRNPNIFPNDTTELTFKVIF